MSNCKNCNEPLSGKYCAACGQPAQLKRVDSHYIIHEIEHVLHFEKGILYTIRELILRPGQTVRHFLSENRSRLVKPIIFLIVASLIYSLVNHFFHIEEEYMSFDGDEASATGVIFAWVQAHYGYANMIMGVFIAWWTKIFFRKYGYNIFEILILLCFVMGIGMLLFAVFALLQGITRFNLMQFGGIGALIYSAWAIGRFFDKKKPASYIKALIAYLLGSLSFVIVAVAIGIIIDLIFKK